MRDASFYWPQVLAVLVTVILTILAFLTVAILEALEHLSLVKAEDMEEKTPKRARLLVKFLSEPNSTQNSLRFVAIVAQFVQVVLITYISLRFFEYPWDILVIGFNILFLVVFTELMPRSLGFTYTDKVALALLGFANLILKIKPLFWVLNALIAITDWIVPGKALRYSSFDSPEELIALADAAVEDDILEPRERDLIESIIDFSGTIVREVMVPRTDMTVVEEDIEVADALEVASEAGFSRLPVISGSVDEVVGLVYVKDLIRVELEDNSGRRVKSLMRKTKFVPETKKVAELLKEMQTDKFHMAVVVDEYGGIAGLATLEDLIEEIVGEIIDEYDAEEPLVERLKDGMLRVDARISIDELSDISGLDLPEGPWDTVGGLVFDEFGKVPKVGDSCEVDRFEFTVERIQGRRISKVRLRSLPESDNKNTSESTSNGDHSVGDAAAIDSDGAG